MTFASVQRPSDSRVEAVLRAAKQWQRELVDTSGRNRLRRYRDLRTGTLDLTPGRAGGLNERELDRLFSGRSANLRRLFPDVQTEPDVASAFNDARRRLSSIHKTALTNREEKGIETLFAAVGLATWKVDSGTPPNAPLVLVPLQVEATGAAARDFKLEVAGDAHLNPVLTHILRADHDVRTDDDEADVAEDPPSSYREFLALLSRLQESWKALPDLEIRPRVVTAIFSYSTMPLVSDLELNGALFAENDIVAAIAGDPEARAALASRICDPDPNQPDVESPAEEFLVLDADSSQHMAINRVLGGESLVIQGPPGTGKSQTISNLITALIARGKRVLFVAEKRAAIEAVTKRLYQAGLSELVMDMHGGVTSRRDFARTLNESLEHIATIPVQDHSFLHSRLQERRDSLNRNDAALHEVRAPWGLSVFNMRERLLTIPFAARTQMRLSAEAARGLDAAGFERLAGEVEEWIGLEGHLLAKNHPEWSRSSVATTDVARRSYDMVEDIRSRRLPAARNTLFRVLHDLQLARPRTVAEWERTVRFLEIASGSWLGRRKAQLLSGEYREMRDALNAPGKLSLRAERLSDLKQVIDALVEGLGALDRMAGLKRLDEAPHADLAAALQRLASGRSTVANLPRIRELEASFRRVGIGNLVEQIGKEISPENAVRAVEHAWLWRVLNDLEFEDRRIASFDGRSHSRHREEYVELDRQHLDSTPLRVRRLAAEAIIATMNAHPEETALIKREAAKKRRHLSVRQLFAQAPHVLSTLRPCWTMSPILASEMIPAERRLFDVVVFDEASQIPPAEAIGSLARAPQAVVAGDSRQLPPTSFFGQSADDGDADDEDTHLSLTKDIESLLDVCGVLLRDQMLQWHYRSRDDRLIAFSNAHIYGGSLTAFAGAIVESPVTHCLVPFRPIMGVTGTRSNPDEVEKVVELVLVHAQEAPDEPLGVIAFGQRHADNIENTLMRRLGEMNDPSLDEFFSESNEERFFVKNIERVQGDERDAIILSVGYHKDVNGNLPYRFGPILQEGGERRLNVAVSRARSRLTLVSSFSHRDMAPGRSSARGVELLRQYLEYAASGGQVLGSNVSDVPLNPFELSIKDGLEKRDIPVTPQYGVSGYRIDFACAHPDEPGRMVLAIEADGASYHSAPTARDRDRLRQEVLEAKGWRFHRIWSTEWFRDRESELDRAEQAWKRAVELSEKDEALADVDSPPDAKSDVDVQSDPQPKRGPRPSVPRRVSIGYNNITDYSHNQLVSLVRWIESDTLLRTDEDVMREMINELGFRRSGSRIRAAIDSAIRDARR